MEELDALAAWINGLLGPEGPDGSRRSPRIRDLHDLALKHYFHPLMGGRTSIKAVLPAVWQSDPALRTHPWFSEYLAVDADGLPLDPYETLEALPFGDDPAEDGVVREGVGAIRAYQDMIFRSASDPRARDRLSRLLLRYCRLDTSAMVMIWMHWTRGSLIAQTR